MVDEYTAIEPVSLQEVRKLAPPSKKRKRLYSWSYVIKSSRTNQFKKHYTATFEVYIPEPTNGDVLEDNDVLIYVKLYNSVRWVSESMTYDTFLNSPFTNMLPEDEGAKLLRQVARWRGMKDEMKKSIVENLQR